MSPVSVLYYTKSNLCFVQTSGSTILFRLRKQLNDISIKKLKYYLSTTYAIFLNDERIKIRVNDDIIIGKSFDNWAYPPEYPPRICFGSFKAGDSDKVDIILTYGLTNCSNDLSGEYGVYFYCNDRLVARELKSLEVGFGVGMAGKPCDAISLSRVIIQLNGKPKYMPWNSSKSDINTGHEIFLLLQDWVIKTLKHVTSLSRRMRIIEGGWKENVFKFTDGELLEEPITDFKNLKTDYFPPLPVSLPRYADLVKIENKEISNKRPWTTGLYESVIAVDLILRSKLEQRNRISLILLDSTLEIGFKEYLVNQASNPISEDRLSDMFKDRVQVHNEMKKISKITDDDWGKIKHYYYIRCQLIHSRASVTITDEDIEKFRAVVERVLLELYGLKFPKSNR